MKPAQLQSRIDLHAIEGDIAVFGAGGTGHAVAVLDLSAAEGSLASADEATQEEILAGRAQFLNAQTAPFQILIRAEPVDLEAHQRHVQERAGLLSELLASVAHDCVGFVATLSRQHTLLERHCYVVLPDSPPEARQPTERLARLIGRRTHLAG